MHQTNATAQNVRDIALAKRLIGFKSETRGGEVRKPDRKLGGDRNMCPSCGLYFNSTRAFEKHRTGEYMDKLFPRRCRTVEEMTDAGMSLNSAGYWVTKKSRF
jgi:hypothetical protein